MARAAADPMQRAVDGACIAGTVRDGLSCAAEQLASARRLAAGLERRRAAGENVDWAREIHNAMLRRPQGHIFGSFANVMFLLCTITQVIGTKQT